MTGTRWLAGVILVLILAAILVAIPVAMPGAGLRVWAQGSGVGGVRMQHATGTFEVKTRPEPLSEVAAQSKMGRLSLDKQFHGGLEAVSVGEMLSAMGEVKGSGGYVAIERVTGTLEGRKGSFVLQHSGTMIQGTPQLSISVVPDSGSGELQGLSGTMTIAIGEGKHSYDFAYMLPGLPAK